MLGTPWGESFAVMVNNGFARPSGTARYQVHCEPVVPGLASPARDQHHAAFVVAGRSGKAPSAGMN